jgi:hypothetical protein
LPVNVGRTGCGNCGHAELLRPATGASSTATKRRALGRQALGATLAC